MRLLFNDQAEYYAVCDQCYAEFYALQWAGSTRNRHWREDSQEYLHERERLGKPCEFCGPGGNGGWAIDGHWPAAERRDARSDQSGEPRQ